jgi:hypothetical protein
VASVIRVTEGRGDRHAFAAVARLTAAILVIFHCAMRTFRRSRSVYQQRALLVAPILLALVACQSSDDRESPARQPAPLAAPAQASVAGASTPSLPHASSATDTMLVRARADLHAGMPTFREWEDSSRTPLSLKDAGSVPFTVGPVLGDFDEDGAPDVAFIGRDAVGERIVAVLSHRGHPTVVPITGDETVPGSAPAHRRWMRLATIFTDRDQIGLEIVVRNERGEFDLPPAEHVYYKGRFMQWISGD